MDLFIIIVVLVILAQTTYLVVATAAKQSRSTRQGVYVDTSVLIDGRILAIAEAGFVPGELVIPRSVLRELQLLADGGDSDKRAKARKGLDLVKSLQDIDGISVRIMQDGKAPRGVDEQLIELAKKYGGSICTIDYNLNKVAQVEGVVVLNINELAKNIRATHMPGEKTKIELVTQGQGSHQGVGYLEDGTMVVVENAVKQVGSVVEVEFIRVLQTDAGKMMFARLTDKPLANKTVRQPAKQAVAKKANGRTKQQSRKQPETQAEEAPSSHVQARPQAQRRQPSGRRRGSKRQDSEDALIALINKDSE